MGRTVEKSAKTVNEAINAALDELKLSIDDVHVDVLDEGKSGLFGLLSGKSAKVRVSELDDYERMPQPKYSNEYKASEKIDNSEDYANDMDDGSDEDERQDAGMDDGADADADADGDEGYEYDIGEDISRSIEYLNKIFYGIHVSAGITAEPTEEGFLLNIESPDSGILIGHKGETLDSIQYLLNLYINKGRDEFIRITVDVESYKKKREAALVRLAERMADKVVRLRRNFTLEAMNSYERRIVHSVLQNHPKVETYSVGEDPNRKVVVTLKNRGGYSSR